MNTRLTISKGKGIDFTTFAVPEVTGNADLTSDLWQEIRDAGLRLTFKKDTFLETPGQHEHDFYCVEKGSVRLIFDTFDGRQRTLMLFRPGAMINLTCAFLQKEASGQHQCVTDCVIWRIPNEILKQDRLVRDYPSLAMAALRQLSNTTLIYSTFLTDLLMDDFVVRFCRFLVSLWKRHERLSFPLGMTQERCATMLGIHRATLGRAIRTLKDEGILGNCTKGNVTILDLERLREQAGL